jgi:hypothetical protein
LVNVLDEYDANKIIVELSSTKQIIISSDNNEQKVILLLNDLNELYGRLQLKKDVLEKVINAHREIIQYGIDTGNERVIAIDRQTGETVDDKTGTSEKVI